MTWVEISVIDDVAADDVRLEMTPHGLVRIRLGQTRDGETRLVGSFLLPPAVLMRLIEAALVTHGVAPPFSERDGASGSGRH